MDVCGHAHIGVRVCMCVCFYNVLLYFLFPHYAAP